MPTDTVTPKSPPTKQEIDDWNNYLKYFNDRVKTDAISDEELDKGDGRYSAEQFAKFHMSSGKNYDYDSQTKKMQDYYNSIYNSSNPMYSEGLKKNYPKPELSKVDGRIGSYTRNYYIPTYTRAELDGKAQAVYNPYADTFAIAQNTTGKSEAEMQQEMKVSSQNAR